MFSFKYSERDDALRFFRIKLTINNWFLLSHKQGRGELKILAHFIDNQFSLALLLFTAALNNKSVMKSCERRVSDSLWIMIRPLKPFFWNIFHLWPQK